MAEKGYTFVREAGVSPRDMKSTAHAKEAHVTIESDQDAYARRKLEERPNLLRQVFGIRYDEHPWYPEAIQKVLSGRDPYQVLLDYAERSPSSAEPVRASGW